VRMRINELRVLVVGAGLAGLAAARALHGAGAMVEVVERSGGPTGEGTGLYLPGNAVRALRHLGLETEVAERAQRIERQRFGDHLGRPLFEVRVDEVWSGVGPCLALPHADLRSVMLAGAGEVPIAWGTAPDALTVNDRQVRVEFGGSVVRFDLVLGADGVHSAVRRLAFGASEPCPVGQYARRFVVGGPADGSEVDRTWSVLLGRGTSFLTIPIGQGRLYCYCDGPADSAQLSLRSLLNGYAEPIPTLLDRLDEVGNGGVHGGAIEEVVLRSWSRGSVLLIGDAAHGTSPNMAQGAAMALEDAVVLVECLKVAADVAAGIALFQHRRGPRTAWVQRQTRRRDRTRNLPPAVRNQVLTRFGRHIFRSNYKPLREPA
jgi:FAD-dependent urate hydroxylase